ncbi:hypothetical protein K8R78_09045 [bacterium]|nr:hypothetical protein [bacterium]
MRWFIILLFVLGTLFIACDTPTDAEPAPIADLLKALETAYNNADLAAYKATLDANSYLFHFCEQDQQLWDAPETFSYEEDINSTENMFNAVGAENIELTLTLPEFEEPADDVNTFVLDEVPFSLYVTLPDDNITYPARHLCKIEMTKVDDKWLISDLWEIISSYGAGNSGQCGHETWGSIKHRFYY